MAKRYSGDIEIRMTVRPYIGWNGRRANFYFASIAAPGERLRGILSRREVGLSAHANMRTPDAYDQAAIAFIRFAHERYGIGKHATYEHGQPVVLRIQHAPCPVVNFRTK